MACCGLPRVEDSDDERSDPRRTDIDISGTGEGARFRRDAARQYDLCVGAAAVRSRDRRSRERFDRTPDRTGAGAAEVMRGNRGFLARQRPQVQRLLHLGGKIRRCECDLCAVFSEQPAGTHLRLRAAMVRAVRYRDRLHRGGVGRFRVPAIPRDGADAPPRDEAVMRSEKPNPHGEEPRTTRGVSNQRGHSLVPTAEPGPSASSDRPRISSASRQKIGAPRSIRGTNRQFLVLSTRAPFLIHGIMSRSLAPTSSIGWVASLARVALNEVWLTLFSSIQSRANLPPWMSASTLRISFLVSSVMMRGPVTYSPYSAVLEIE